MNTNPPTDSEINAAFAELRADIDRDRAELVERERELDRFNRMANAVQWVIVGIAAGIVVYGLAVLA